MAPEFFPRVDIRQMHFHCGDLDGTKRVANGDAVMRKGARVDQDPVCIPDGCMDPVNNFPLMIGLKIVQFDSGSAGGGSSSTGAGSGSSGAGAGTDSGKSGQ